MTGTSRLDDQPLGQLAPLQESSWDITISGMLMRGLLLIVVWIGLYVTRNVMDDSLSLIALTIGSLIVVFMPRWLLKVCIAIVLALVIVIAALVLS